MLKLCLLMAAILDGGRVSPDTILKVYYPRTIHAIFALNWLTGFRGEDLNNFPISLMLKL
jgi:hypothetical protein